MTDLYQTDPGWGLEVLGWSEHFADQLTARDRERGRPGRVVEAYRKRFLMHLGDRVVWALARGSMFHRARTNLDLPAVGDWAVLEFAEPSRPEQARLWRLLDRRTALVRQAAGERTRPQVIAANVDTIFVVTSCNQDFNLRRLERYLALVEDSGARPIVLLNKADLCAAPAPLVEQVEALAPDLEVLATSMVEPIGQRALAEHIEPGHTFALIGSSGVGKSTIINHLRGESVLATGSIRETDGRGRHTTTARQLLVLRGGELLLDTPGMRELGLWQTEQEVLEAFEGIDELAQSCKFRDCRHEHEIGCAVKQAVEDGELEPERLMSWRKLCEELDAQRQRRVEGERIERRRGAVASRRRRGDDR